MSIDRCSSIFDPFSLDLLDPFQGFPFDTFRSIAESRPAFVSETSTFANTRIDWKETSEAHVFKADLPGMKKEEVKEEVEEGYVLQISGEHSREEEEKSDKWHCVERSSGSFLRRFRLEERQGGPGENVHGYDALHSHLLPRRTLLSDSHPSWFLYLSKNDKVDQVKTSMDMMHSILIFFRDERF